MSIDPKKKLIQPVSERLLSIDALRGFDMFWIIGGDALVRKWADYGDWPLKEQIQAQVEHVSWEGFHFYDLIFPLFLFVVGTVLPFSLGNLVERGEPPARIYGRIVRRTVLLFALGLLCNNILQFNFSELRIAGVLQRIALCYGLAALITVHSRPWSQALLTAAILLGYWALLINVGAPDSHPGDYSMEGNLAGYLDRTYLPGKIMKPYYGFGDNEGILSTLPAVATTLLGVLAGQWLRSEQSDRRKVFGLVLAGGLCLILGTVWSFWFPIIKNIWTSSFVLVAGGCSFLLLALFYGIIDVLRFRAWAFFFIVIGANAITIYVVPRFVDFTKMAHFFFDGVFKYSGEFQPVLLLICILILKWLFLLFLYRNRLFLRV